MIGVVGVVDPSALSARARSLVRRADLVVGAPRLLPLVDAGNAPTTAFGDLSDVIEAVGRIHASGGSPCVLASGDPGFFGIVRALASRFGAAALTVEPAPSSVAMAFARLGLPWDDAIVVSAHGRPLAVAAALAAASPKVAVLTGPLATPASLGVALAGLGAVHEHVAVCSALGTSSELIGTTDLAGLAAGTWDPLSVVVLWSGTGVSPVPAVRWGQPVAAFDHRPGMITKPDVRAVVIATLSPGGATCLWDIGAGSGSVGIECAVLAPGVPVIAVERDPDAGGQIVANARAHGVAVRVVTGAAPDALGALPEPDRAFVGGGGLPVLRAVWERVRPGGRVVATHAALDRAAAAADLLGNLSCVTASSGRRLPDGGWRLEGANPVFVTWGVR
jgi:precorrin-6B C5,15-methyltransferase / cobalt-precorrin-6B C5,C15-methyltransferase